MKKVTQLLLTNKNENAYGNGMLKNTDPKKNRQLLQQPPVRKYIKLNILTNLKRQQKYEKTFYVRIF